LAFHKLARPEKEQILREVEEGIKAGKRPTAQSLADKYGVPRNTVQAWIFRSQHRVTAAKAAKVLEVGSAGLEEKNKELWLVIVNDLLTKLYHEVVNRRVVPKSMADAKVLLALCQQGPPEATKRGAKQAERAEKKVSPMLEEYPGLEPQPGESDEDYRKRFMDTHAKMSKLKAVNDG